MKNVKMTIKGTKLVITADLGVLETGEVELSSKGKSYVIASTGGNIPLRKEGYEKVLVGMNVYIPKKYYTPPKQEQKQETEQKQEGGVTISKEDFELFQQFKAFLAMQKQNS